MCGSCFSLFAVCIHMSTYIDAQSIVASELKKGSGEHLNFGEVDSRGGDAGWTDESDESSSVVETRSEVSAHLIFTAL